MQLAAPAIAVPVMGMPPLLAAMADRMTPGGAAPPQRVLRCTSYCVALALDLLTLYRHLCEGRGLNCRMHKDGLNAVLLRLVATSGAEQLCRCAGVCRMWYAEAVNEELWQVLLRRRWGEAADEICESWQPGAAEAAMSSRALYVRSVTTRVLSWGQGARSQEEVGMFV